MWWQRYDLSRPIWSDPMHMIRCALLRAFFKIRADLWWTVVIALSWFLIFYGREREPFLLSESASSIPSLQSLASLVSEFRSLPESKKIRQGAGMVEPGSAVAVRSMWAWGQFLAQVGGHGWIWGRNGGGGRWNTGVAVGVTAVAGLALAVTILISAQRYFKTLGTNPKLAVMLCVESFCCRCI